MPRFEMIRRSARTAHRNERGAVTILVLAAVLVITMVGLVLYDAAELGTDKTHVQTATDASAYSQATVQAQSMNQLAFANVGKRMTVGMVNSYISVVQWLTWVGQIATLLEYASWALYLVPGMQSIADQLRQAASAASDLADREQSVRSEAIASKSAKCQYYICIPLLFTEICFCARRYDETPTQTWEWAAPDTNWPWAPPVPPGCIEDGFSIRPTLSCANGDIYNWHPQQLMPSYYGRDLLAYDNYQRYLLSISPFWAWTEGVARGLTNSAPVTVGYPLPEFDQDQSHTAGLPVRRASFEETCQRGDDVDRGLTEPLALEYLLKNIESAVGGASAGDFADVGGLGDLGGGGFAGAAGKIIALTIAGVMTFEVDPPSGFASQFFPRSWETLCTDITGQLLADSSGGGTAFSGWTGAGGGGDYVSGFREFGEPYLLNEYQWNEADWFLDSSNLMFGYRPNAHRFEEGRDKFIVGRDHQAGEEDGVPGTEAGGVWALSRGEMAFQDGEPTAWAPDWAARLRPVALPGEWEAYSDMEMASAFEELVPTLGYVTTFAHLVDDDEDLLTHPHEDFNDAINEEFAAIRAAVEGMQNERMEGLAR